MLQNILLGVLFISIGVWIFILTYRNPDSQLKSSDLKGYIGGVGLIALGILCALGKIKW